MDDLTQPRTLNKREQGKLIMWQHQTWREAYFDYRSRQHLLQKAISAMVLLRHSVGVLAEERSSYAPPECYGLIQLSFLGLIIIAASNFVKFKNTMNVSKKGGTTVDSLSYQYTRVWGVRTYEDRIAGLFA